MEASEFNQDEATEAHPNEGEIEEAVEDTDLDESPEDAGDGDDSV